MTTSTTTFIEGITTAFLDSIPLLEDHFLGVNPAPDM
jgi:hypothetical protein